MTPSTVGKSYTHVCTAKPHTVFGAAIVVPIIETVSANKNVAIFCAGGCFNVTMCLLLLLLLLLLSVAAVIASQKKLKHSKRAKDW